MLCKARINFHQPPLKGTLIIGNALPRFHRFIARCQSCSRRNNPHFQLTPVNTRSIRLPAIVKLAFIFSRPFGENVVWAVHGARSPVHQKGPVGGMGLSIIEPARRLFHHILGQVIFFVVRRLNGIEIPDQSRLPLRCFTGEEAKKMTESVTWRWRQRGIESASQLFRQ
jgi:hypothetical protein